MISQTVEYALRAIITIAQHEGLPCTAQQISEIAQVPAPYLSKLMQRLVRAGIASSQRGLHGGFILVQEPSKLTIWEIIEAVEPFKQIHKCPLDIESHTPTRCPLHRRLGQAMEMVEKQFRNTTISDILEEQEAIKPPCQEKKMILIQANLDTKKRPAAGNQKKAKKKKE